MAVLVSVARLAGLRRFGPAALPLKIHNFAWAVAFFLLGLPLIDYSQIPTSGWLLLGIGIIGFNVGAIVCLSGRRATGVRPPPPVLRRSVVLEWIVPILFFLGALLYLRAISAVFGLATFIHQPSLVRSHQGDSAFEAAFSVPGRMLFGLGPLCFVVYALPAISGIAPSMVRRVIVLLATVVGLAISLGRSLLLVGLVWAAMALFLTVSGSPVTESGTRARKRFGKIAAASLVGGLVVFQGVALLLGKTGQTDQRLQSHVSPVLRGSPLTSAVVYLSAGVPSFGILVSDAPARYQYPDELLGPFYGKAVVTPVAKIAALQPPDEVRPFTNNPIPNNVYTYLDAFWLDFRAPGVVMFPPLFGFGLTYVAARRVRSPEAHLAKALLIGLTLWVPFGYTFGATYTWSALLVLGSSILVGRWGRGMARAHGVLRVTDGPLALRVPAPSYLGDDGGLLVPER
ncbi:MAG: oligosaccharide repeat unit polymerase [Actinomycetota bacterium]|nr:oligosaccharide repeat unit polymerase [Actinomycetota bacterium]